MIGGVDAPRGRARRALRIAGKLVVVLLAILLAPVVVAWALAQLVGTPR
ncbi:hypothetical protein KZ810_14980 [Sphingomonas sp. RHCKR47]|nr:hypothetical protein [Sphingomonas citricola]MBW6524803.1 hypothetical protein [Sphingomonas citricola]